MLYWHLVQYGSGLRATLREIWRVADAKAESNSDGYRNGASVVRNEDIGRVRASQTSIIRPGGEAEVNSRLDRRCTVRKVSDAVGTWSHDRARWMFLAPPNSAPPPQPLCNSHPSPNSPTLGSQSQQKFNFRCTNSGPDLPILTRVVMSMFTYGQLWAGLGPVWAAWLLLISFDMSAFITSPKLIAFLDSPNGTTRPVLKFFLALWLLVEANAALSRWAENRWTWQRDTNAWRWQNEIAVVTGGSRGIGAVVVQQLVALGVKVAVLDVVPLSDGLEKGRLSSCVARSGTEPHR